MEGSDFNVRSINYIVGPTQPPLQFLAASLAASTGKGGFLAAQVRTRQRASCGS